ncbi:MAG: hypothetical protein CL946_06245 [Ectothiorhodospiraceae bacterium]|nr:hypothetical protein [Ectothiorhodospiraceae bacterium]
MIADLGDWRGEVVAEIRRIVHEVDPDVVEEWKWKGTPVWSNNGMYAHVNGFKKYVKLTFLHGAQLKDPKKLFNAGLSGNKWRAIDIHEGDTLNRSALKALLREAIAYNKSHNVPKSKGSTGIKRSKTTARKEVKLLSGGNPQIPKGDGDGPVQDYIAAMPGWKSAAGKKLDRLIVKTVPGVKKAVRWNSPFYEVDDQGYFISFYCYTKYIKITFLKGAHLDPKPPVGSKDPDARYFHIYEAQDYDKKQLADWIRQAAALPGWKPGK